MTNIVYVKLEKELIIFGGGHAATIARAAKKGPVKPKAIVVVEPTWACPFLIVFG